MGYTSVTISGKRYNGLVDRAEKDGRSIAGELDWILKNAGIEEIDSSPKRPQKVKA